MEITEVRVKLVRDANDRLKAFCSMTLDNEFVVRDIRVIEGTEGYFVAMPSRKMTDRCPGCGGKNHLKANFCNSCGTTLPANRTKKDTRGKVRFHADIAHPINAGCRQRIQKTVVSAFEKELDESRQPGYKPLEFDEPDDDGAD